MKYIVIDETKTDMYTAEFDNKDEALEEARIQFNRLTNSDLKNRIRFYVLESVNPDEDADNHYDGDIVKNYI